MNGYAALGTTMVMARKESIWATYLNLIIVAKMCGTARLIPMLLYMTPTCSVLPVSGQIRWFRVCKGTG
jgi:hypothetical protein